MRRFRFIVVAKAFILTSGLSLIFSCSEQSPSDLRRWYSSNYPTESHSEETAKKSPSKEQEVKDELSTPKREEAKQDRLDKKKPKKQLANSEPELQQTQQSKTNEHIFHSETTIKGQLNPPIEIKLASESDNREEYGAASMIESKLYRLVEDAYERRDPTEFVRLYNFFLESFPHSSRKAYLDDRMKSFFYSEDIAISKFKSGLVEVTYPDAKTLDELGQYFSKLNSNGFSTIQLEVVQMLGAPVYLFASQRNKEGYYFKLSDNLLVDNLLNKITALAHDAGLKVMASFPLRHHPRLGISPEYIVDESWNAYQNRTLPNGKLDLLNPNGKSFLMSLTKSLCASKVDGIVLKDDFTYDVVEGFSKKAIERYNIETGRTVVFNRIFRPIKQKKSDSIEMLIGEDFEDMALWRTRELKQLLWDLVSLIKQSNSEIFIGLEITPEMILDPRLSLKWYSTGLHYIKDLDVDFFILKWRKYKSPIESDPADFKHAALKLREAVAGKKEIYLKVPLSEDTKNVIKLNRRINHNATLLEEMNMTKLAIGPVSRVNNFAFLNQ